MRFKRNDHYFTIAVYVVATMISILLIGVMICNFRALWGYLARGTKAIFSLLKPLIFGLIIAYLFDPIVEMYDKRCVPIKCRWLHKKKALEKRKVRKRGLPTMLAFLTFLSVLGIVIFLISVNVKDLIGTFSDRGFHELMEHYMRLFRSMLEDVSGVAAQTPFFENHTEVIHTVYGALNQFTLTLVEKIVSLGQTIAMNLIPLALGFVIAFYALNDKKNLLVIYHKILKRILPQKINTEVRAIGCAIDYVFSGYIRGQIIDAIIMATLISVVLTLIGIDFAVIIGIISGIFNLIPYFGPIVGFILAGFIGIIGPEPMKAVYAVVAVMALQQLDGWVIVPRIMGETVKLHPIVVLLSIVIGGQLFGFVGFLVGVPIAGFIRLMIIRYMGNLFEN